MTARAMSAIAPVASAAAAVPAHASGIVCDESPRDGDAGVLSASTRVQTLAGGVVWHAARDYHLCFGNAQRTAAQPLSGLPIGPNEPLMRRDANRRFAAAERYDWQNDAHNALASLTRSRRLTRWPRVIFRPLSV